MTNPSNLALTEEQAAIVAHAKGPALVYAVAGSGKTTAMVYRIARLVDKRIFAPQHILATSFNKDANRQIQAALLAWPACARVQVRTLHALGFVLVRRACEQGHLAHLDLEASLRGVEHNARRVLYATLSRARRDNATFRDELGNLDEEDFLAYVSACKGSLAYPEAHWLDLPSGARQVATIAQGPCEQPWYLDLFTLFEEVRYDLGVLSFDDMLMSGWEVLVRHPALLAAIRDQFRCVMVDEFQDVNLAQAEMLDLIVAPHGNYMAIGDDDQTIYEWRGASQHHFLTFQRRYRAKIYQLTENFRSQAEQIALANQIIKFNEQRQPKQIRLTQGFDGSTTLCSGTDQTEMGTRIAEQIADALDAGYSPSDMAVLVRLYAQTVFIEQALLVRAIPYRVIGSAPFYARTECAVFLNYCRLAQWERKLLDGKRVPAAQQQSLMQLWSSLYNRPLRYISAAQADQVVAGVLREGLPFNRMLQTIAGGASEQVAARMVALGEVLAWLATELHAPAAKVLPELDTRLGYAKSLGGHRGAEAANRLLAETTEALSTYAESKGSVTDFVDHVDRLIMCNRAVSPAASVTVTTIFRAKGLEWPVVFVPHCNQGILPLDDTERVEEERRLLYVAITRARNHLYLHHVADEPISQFLHESTAETIIAAVDEMKQALQRHPRQWTPGDFAAIGINARRLGFESYFMRWWNPKARYRTEVAKALLSFFELARTEGYWEALQVQPQEMRFWQRAAGQKRVEQLELAGTVDLLVQLQDIVNREQARRAAEPAPR